MYSLSSTSQQHVLEKQKFFSKLISRNSDVRTEQKHHKDITVGSYNMQGRAPKCVERQRGLAHKTINLFGQSPKKTRRHGNCIDMLVFGKNWKTRSTLDLKLLGKISYKVEPSVRSSISTCPQLHSSHNQLQTVLSR